MYIRTSDSQINTTNLRTWNLHLSTGRNTEIENF